MPLKSAKRNRNTDRDEDPRPSRSRPKVVQERHTLYDGDSTPSHSFLPVPLSPPRIVPSGDINTNFDLPDLLDVGYNSDKEEKEDYQAHNEDENRELEAVGLLVDSDAHKRARTQTDNPLLMWVPYIDAFVDELLRLEGRGDLNSQTHCAGSTCEASVTKGSLGFRCHDCHDAHLFCATCIVGNHSAHYLHQIQEWNGVFFKKISLRSLGLCVQLGHPDDNVCPTPQRSSKDEFVVIDSDGIHNIALNYCNCQQSLPKHVQLLRARLFPSTVVDPRTAATFRVLDNFQMLSFTSKISAFEFYRALARRTDNTGTSPPPDRYHAFMRIIREWRHVLLLKRMGRGHAESGVKGTAEGQLAVLCPACPLPGINLPENWKTRPESERWLNTLFIGIDANFRLKRLNVSSDERDPGLNHGYAYVVENKAFKAYLAEYNDKIPDDKSTCNNHDAIKSASMRGGKGTAASGLGTVDCSRHDMKRPTAVGDLQKGERYVNMDYFVLSSLRDKISNRLVVSYDIACQWSRNLDARCNIYPPNTISQSDLVRIDFLVPKFHLPAHVSQCQIDYSFNLVPNVGRTDGEAPERGWAMANAVASSTKEMGPGSRRDTLDDHFGDNNWRKIAQIAETFVRKSEEAITFRQEHVDAFVEFDAALSMDLTSAWTKLCQTWEADRSKENPFLNHRLVLSDVAVRLQLAKEDAERLARGERFALHDDVSPSQLIYQGLEIEDCQQRHALDVSKLGSHATDLQQAKVLEHANTLRRRIDAWIEIQQLYIPSIAPLRARTDLEGGGSPPAVEDIELFLPSQTVDLIPCDIELLRYEFRIRISQADETLDNIRTLLLMRSHMYRSKDRLVRGQAQQTRSHKLIGGVSDRIKAAAGRYRRIWNALSRLSSPLLESAWRTKFRVLHDDDMVGLTSLDTEGSEGRKKLTWIWTVQGTGANGKAETDNALRVEWSKARARAHRWQEECLLLNEEMCRVIAYFTWAAQKWQDLAQSQYNNLPISSSTNSLLAAADIASQNIVREGKIAYACRQALIRQEMASFCSEKWRLLPSKLTNMDGWDARVMIECH